MSQITDGLTTKIGPAPAWVYGAGLGVVILVVRARRAKKSTPPPVVASDGAAPGGVANSTATDAALGGGQAGTVGGYPVPSGYQSNPGGVIDHTGGSSTGSTSGPTSADDWSSQAYNALIAKGYNAIAVTEALRKYLAGEPVTASEEGMIGIALRDVGPVPGGAPALTRAAPAPIIAAPSVPTQTEPIPGPQYDPRAPAPSMPSTPAPTPVHYTTLPGYPPAGYDTAAPDVVQAYRRPVLSKGDHGPAVTALAQWLNVVTGATAYNAERTGDFDDTLDLAVRNFQRVVQVTPDGIVAASTWVQIQNVAAQRSTPIPAY